jgi:hypothetical protein
MMDSRESRDDSPIREEFFDEEKEILHKLNENLTTKEEIERIYREFDKTYQSKVLGTHYSSDTESSTKREHNEIQHQKDHPSTLEEYETLLRINPKVREYKNFETDDNRARIYYRIKEILTTDDLSHLSDRAKWRLFEEQFSVRRGTIKAWFGQNKTPTGIHSVWLLERGRLRDNNVTRKINEIRTLYKPNSLEEYLSLLERHQNVTEHSDFETRDRYARAYFEIKAMRAANPTTSFTKLSELFDIPRGALVPWFNHQIPDIFHQLASNERLLRKRESNQQFETKSHLVEPFELYEVLGSLKQHESLEPLTLATTLGKFLPSEDEKLALVEFRPYNKYKHPQWLRQVEKSVEDNLKEIEQVINDKFSKDSLKYRLGFVNRTLYIWKREGSLYDFLNLFDGECFYFDEHDRKSLIGAAHKNLNLRGNHIFSRLLRQITEVNTTHRESKHTVVPDLRHDKDYLYGESLRFILDVIGKDLKEIGPNIRAIGQQEQIRNPKILDSEELLILMARLYSITASDGHVGNRWNFLGYHEHTPERIEIVNKFVRSLGDVSFSYFKEKSKLFGIIPREKIVGVRYPHVLGRLMIKLGIPSGDKSIQNVGLPDFILNGPPEVMRAYLEEVIPEDGMITITNKTRSIRISRNAVLYDEVKGEQYSFEQKITNAHLYLFHKYGAPQKGLVESLRFPIGDLRKLSKSDRPTEAKFAKQLLDSALNNPVSLLEDEYQLIRKLNIHCRPPLLESVIFHPKSNRVSTLWRLSVLNQVSMAKWGIIAAPNDNRKREILFRWMKRNPDKVSEATSELRADGLIP